MKKLLLLIGILIATPVMAGGLATLINPYGDKVVVEVNSQTAQEYFGENFALYEEETLGSVASSPALFRTNLASKLTNTGTSMTLVSATTRDGTELSGSVCFTIDGNLATAEYVCGTASSTSITALERGLGSDGTTEYTALKFAHRYGAEVKITDFPILQRLTNIINGDSDFPNSLTVVGKVTATSTAPTADGDLANKKYVDDTAIAGAPDMTSTVKGLGEKATGAEAGANASDGSGDTSAPLVLTSDIASSTSASENLVVVTESDGKINQGFLDLTEDFTFSGDNTYSGTNDFTDETSFSATSTLADITNGHTVSALTASTTITGATTPQPVYIASSTNAEAGGVLLCDGNDQDTTEFIGFAITSASSGETVYIQKDGIVDGFSSLTIGADYYVQDAVGTIGTTIGTYEILVGTAISATEILIRKGSFQFIGSDAFSTNSPSAGTNCVTTSVIPVNAKIAIIDILYSEGLSADKIRGEFSLTVKGKTTGGLFGTSQNIADTIATSATITGSNLVITTPFLGGGEQATHSGTIYYYN